MTNNPMVTVVIPVYNLENYVAAAVGSRRKHPAQVVDKHLSPVVEAQKGLKVTFTTKKTAAALRTLIVDFQAIFTA